MTNALITVIPYAGGVDKSILLSSVNMGADARTPFYFFSSALTNMASLPLA